MREARAVHLTVAMPSAYLEATAWTVTCLSGALSGIILGVQRVPQTSSIVVVSLIAGAAFVACAPLVRASRASRERD